MGVKMSAYCGKRMSAKMTRFTLLRASIDMALGFVCEHYGVQKAKEIAVHIKKRICVNLRLFCEFLNFGLEFSVNFNVCCEFWLLFWAKFTR